MVDLVRVGGILRAERKKAGKSIELMSEELAMGTTTISSMERGLPTVSIEKYQYYAEKLGKGMLFGMAGEAEKKIIALREQLKDIEEILLANPEKAIADLNKLNKAEKVESIPLLQPYFYDLKGKYFLTQKEWKLAEDYYSQAIQIAENQPEVQSSNVATGCYIDLGLVFYQQDLFYQALDSAEKGLNCIVHDGERSYYYALLLLNKSIYLERLNLLEKSLLCIERLEEYIRENHSLKNEIRRSVIIQMYVMYADVLSQLNLNERALTYVKKGIHLALKDRDYGHLFRLWGQTSAIYANLNDMDNAERYFLKAMDLEPKLQSKEDLFPYAFVHFAKLLIKKQQWNHAKEIIERSIQICRKNKVNSLLAQSLFLKGDWHLQQKHYKDAIQLFLESEKMSLEFNFKKTTINNISKLCTCYKALKDETNFLIYAEKIYEFQEGGI